MVHKFNTQQWKTQQKSPSSYVSERP